MDANQIIAEMQVKPQIDVEFEITRRVSFIKNTLVKSGLKTLVLGISGGNIGFGTALPQSYFHVTGDTRIDGSLTVQGDFTTINQTTIQVDDKNIELGVGALNDQDVDGGGITLRGQTDKIISWQTSNDSWNFSENIFVSGSGNFSQGLYVGGQPVMVQSESSANIWNQGSGLDNKTLNINI